MRVKVKSFKVNIQVGFGDGRAFFPLELVKAKQCLRYFIVQANCSVLLGLMLVQGVPGPELSRILSLWTQMR